MALLRPSARRASGVAAAAGAALLGVAVLAAALVQRGEAPPASPEALERIGEKNREAAIDAAAQMKTRAQDESRAVRERTAADNGETRD